MKLAILLYGLFRHKCSISTWNNIVTPRNAVDTTLFVFSTHTNYPNTRRSGDTNITITPLLQGIRKANSLP